MSFIRKLVNLIRTSLMFIIAAFLRAFVKLKIEFTIYCIYMTNRVNNETNTSVQSRIKIRA